MLFFIVHETHARCVRLSFPFPQSVVLAKFLSEFEPVVEPERFSFDGADRASVDEPIGTAHGQPQRFAIGVADGEPEFQSNCVAERVLQVLQPRNGTYLWAR